MRRGWSWYFGAVSDDVDKRGWLRSLPSYGPDWDAAIEFGIDVSLIEENLALTPQQRLEQLVEQLRLDEELRRAGKALRNAAD